MKTEYQPKSTKKMQAVDCNLVQDSCSEKECGMTILVDKEDKAAGRKSRCMACLMRAKMAKGEIR